MLCDYPLKVINKAFHNAKLQGPAPKPQAKNETLPFITTHASNIDNSRTVKLCNELLNNAQDDHIRNVFGKSNIVLACKQPPNLLMQLSKSKFNTSVVAKEQNGIYKCKDKRCLICKNYLQECTSFITSNNVEWHVKSHITCHSKCVIYFLKCLSCHVTTYTGKTNNLRKRTNVHISSCRTGNSSDKFDAHVFQCRKRHNIRTEPLFKLLMTYESYFHHLNFDTFNRYK